MIDIKSNVKVSRKCEDGSWSVLHRGVVVGLTTSHAKVYNPKDRPGDTVPEYAEWFAIGGNCIRCEEIAA